MWWSRSIRGLLRWWSSLCSRKRSPNKKKMIKKSSSALYHLDPTLDAGLVRVGGRLKQSSLIQELKHPVILPKDSYITTLKEQRMAELPKEHVKVSAPFTLHLKTKMSWCQTPSWKKRAVVYAFVTMSAYQDQLNAGFSKVCENMWSLWHILFKIHSRVLHTSLVFFFSRP